MFFDWLVKQKGYTHIHNKGITLLYLVQNERNEAKMTDIQKIYTINKLLSTIKNIKGSAEIEKRDKAFLSLYILTTPCITALINARISSIQFLEENNAWVFIQKKIKKRRLITAFFIGQNCESIQDINKKYFRVERVSYFKRLYIKRSFIPKNSTKF